MAAVLYPYLLGHGNLHMIDILPIPDRFKQGIGETEGQDVLYGFLSQVMVDSVNLGFMKKLSQQVIKCSG